MGTIKEGIVENTAVWDKISKEGKYMEGHSRKPEGHISPESSKERPA